MFWIERRRHFRYESDIALSIRPAGDDDYSQLGAAGIDLSMGGVRILLDGLPAWKINESIGRDARYDLELDLRSHGSCRLQGRPVRVVLREHSCELSMRFVSVDAEQRKQLGGFLRDYHHGFVSDSVRARYRSHRRKRRIQMILALTLLTSAGIGLSFAIIDLIEAFPDWFRRGQSTVRRELREFRREVIADEIRRIRDSGRTPAQVYGEMSEQERGDIRRLLTEEERKSLGRLLTEEERAQLKRIIEKTEPPSK